MAKHAIIIGSMKCGTTSLFRYLVQHPDICGSDPKEPQYFSDRVKHCKGLNNYLDLWKCNDRKILLEGSTNYTKYPAFTGAPSAIYDYNINPLFIYMVRNPFHRIISHYNHKVRNNDPCSILDKHLINTSNYYLQLKQYKRFFPDENIKVIDFNEFIDNTDSVVNGIFKFLGLETVTVNTSKVHHKTRSNIFSSYYRKIVKGNSHELKTELTSEEYNYIRELLLPDMLKLSSEYNNIDVSRWGF